MSKQQKKVITTTFLPAKTLKGLKVFAAKHDRSMSDVMEKALGSYMKKVIKPNCTQ